MLLCSRVIDATFFLIQKAIFIAGSSADKLFDLSVLRFISISKSAHFTESFVVSNDFTTIGEEDFHHYQNLTSQEGRRRFRSINTAIKAIEKWIDNNIALPESIIESERTLINLTAKSGALIIPDSHYQTFAYSYHLL